MQQIFGRVNTAEWSTTTTQTAPFLYHVLLEADHNSSSSNHILQIIATDFQFNTFQAIKSRYQLEDLRDDIGVGGSWSDFVDYITTSLKSGDVKLIMEGSSGSGGASSAKLIAQKAKGMPRISIALSKLVDDAAREAMANLSLELFKEFKEVQCSLVKEKESTSQLTKIVAAEQEKNDTLQKQLDMAFNSRKHKSHKINDVDNPDSALVSMDSPGKQATYNPSSSKVPNRVVPAHRRSKVRGAILGDTEEEANN